MATPSDLTAIILAAGGSTRMGSEHKLLLPFQGKPLIAHVARTVTEAAFGEVLVVTGARRADLQAVLVGLPVRMVHNPRWAAGMGTSLAAGVARAPEGALGYAVFLGDMPLLRPTTLVRLVQAFCQDPTAPLVPMYQGQRGHPVFFPAAARPRLLALEGDTGARATLQAHAPPPRSFPIDDPGVLQDIDTPQDYRRHQPSSQKP